MSDQNDLTTNVTLYDENGNQVGVILDGSVYRLAVDAKINGTVPVAPGRVTSPIHVGDGYNNNQTKISYTVPTGKILYIQRLWGSHESDAAGHTIAYRVSGTQFFWITYGDDTTATFEKIYPESNPYILTAGQVLTACRIDGSSNEDWTAGFDGYLENA